MDSKNMVEQSITDKSGVTFSFEGLSKPLRLTKEGPTVGACQLRLQSAHKLED